MDEREYWLGFSVFPGIGPKRFQELYDVFGSAENAWRAPVTLLAKVVGDVLSAKLDAFRSSFSLSEYSEKLLQNDVSYLILSDLEYPKRLRLIKNAPFVLYFRGNSQVFQENSFMYVGVVGTRRISSYGREVTQLFTRGLADAGCVIVSGLAMGVDAIAHQETLDRGGITIAVLGSGVDLCFPSINQTLYSQIIEKKGAIVSEYPLGALPSKGSFPSRNRIIAGLSDAVVVTEGAADSGALITASDAKEHGRRVFAVPGPITSSLSKGPYALLQQGAMLVTSPEDILRELHISHGVMSGKRVILKGDTKDEQKVIDLLREESLQFDEIVQKTGIDPISMGTLLSLMEMKGFVRNIDAGKFSLEQK